MSMATIVPFSRPECIAVACRSGTIPRVRVACTFASRCMGLLNRSRLDEEEGLLLIPGYSVHTWWMRFSIDVIFLDAQLEVLHVVSNLRPWRIALAPPDTHCVLELAAGVAERSGIERGIRLRICR